MNIGRWYVRHGRIDRPTYWLHYFLPLFAVSVVLEVIVLATAGPGLASAAQSGSTATPSPALIWLPLVVSLALACPSISSQVTRLHDRGHSAWWLLFSLLPIAGAIVLIVQMCLPGEPGANRYGPPPAPRNQVPEPPYPATYG